MSVAEAVGEAAVESGRFGNWFDATRHGVDEGVEFLVLAQKPGVHNSLERYFAVFSNDQWRSKETDDVLIVSYWMYSPLSPH